MRAVGLEVGDVIGVADQPARGVAALGEESEEAAGDLAVTSGDEDVHASRLRAGGASAPT